MDNNFIFEEGRGYRHKKPKMEPVSCPICGITIRTTEIDQHFAFEVERLDKLSYQTKPRTKSGSSGSGEPSSSHSNNMNSIGECSKSETEKLTNPDECWGTYQKIKTNRQARLKLKSRKRKSDENVCPVCNKKPTEEISVHVEKCLRKSENGNTNGNDSDDDDESIDVEGESWGEEYEFDGETRIRVGSFHPTGVGTRITNADTDDELNVDGDDSQIYGPPQYSERDVIIPKNEDEKDGDQLRNLVIGNQPFNIHRSNENHEAGEGSSRIIPETKMIDIPQNNPELAVEILRSRIREYENYMHNRPKCLICMDDFKKAVVSVSCWHVYCEECWLRTLAAKKLCPQCSMITSPGDLRRIYL